MALTDYRPSAMPDQRSNSHGNTLKLLRAVFLILLVVFTAIIIVTDSTLADGGIQLERWAPVAILGVFLFFAGVIALDILTPKRKLSTISALFVGLIAGVVVAAILGIVIDLFGEIYEFQDKKLLQPFKILMGIGICYLTISTVLQTQDDFRLVIPYIEFTKKIRGARPMLVDTSALIDGRLLGLAEGGMIQSPVIVPRFVIDELQRLSDSTDRIKRSRGRRGLEMVAKLQRCALIDLSIEQLEAAGSGVDQMLIEVARSMPGTIVTTDSGLARVASIQSVPVVNINEIANSLRPTIIPGEQIRLMVLKRGELAGQGVGYLDDGTMVVVEDGAESLGTEATITITNATQTSAGRLIFGRIQPLEEHGAEEFSKAATRQPDEVAQAETRAGDGGSISALPESPSRGPFGPGRPENPGRTSRNPRRG